MDGLYQSLKTEIDWTKAFALQFFHVHLLLYAKFLLKYEDQYMEHRQPIFDPRRSRFKRGHLKQITRDSCRIQEMKRAGDRLVQTAEAWMQIVEETFENGDQALSTQPPSVPASESMPRPSRPSIPKYHILGYCQEIRGCLSRLSNSLEHDLRFLGLGRDMEQTSDVQQLTVLATIFLPLSLGAAVLSMQTRFKELGPLLYDFIGVVAVLGACVIPFLLFFNLLKFATSQVLVEFDMRMQQESKELSKELSKAYPALKTSFQIFFWLGLILTGLVILVSFLVGMFKDVPLGGKILGYGLASCTFLAIVLPFPLWIILSFGRIMWDFLKVVHRNF